MDIFSILVSLMLGFITLVVLYVLYMSRKYMVFRRMGIKHLTPWPAIGSYPILGKLGIMGFITTVYNKFPDEKVYGYYMASNPALAIRDLDMMREIMVKNFNCFVNRRSFATEEPFNSALTNLKEDHWRHVRNTISPTFSSGKLKKMSLLVEETAKSLTSNIRRACREGKEIELKHVIGCYTMDAIANTGFGVSVDSLNDENSPFVTEAKRINNFGGGFFALVFLFPLLVKLMNKVGLSLLPKTSMKFFASFFDAAIKNRNADDSNSQKRHDFIQLMVAETKKNESSNTESGSPSLENGNQERKGLTRLEFQGQAFIFILGGFETVASVLSFAFFILAHKPDVTRKVQDELDEVLAGKAPTYDDVNNLVYLDMCINEAMRMYPPGFITDRVCTQDCEVGGVQIPKGMAVVFPLVAIYNDPQYFPNPEDFDPERFSAENKASRHPFAFMPFGQGPRNCIGMRLALIEMKIAMASVLQEMTPVPCSKSVYPPKLNKYQLKAEDGLWVKFITREEGETNK